MVTYKLMPEKIILTPLKYPETQMAGLPPEPIIH